MASRDPGANKGRLSPVSYGSSHIQAVAFTDRGVAANTILTYGQSLNRRSPWSSDQTRLFSEERWVVFAFTPKQIRRACCAATGSAGGPDARRLVGRLGGAADGVVARPGSSDVRRALFFLPALPPPQQLLTKFRSDITR